MRFGPHKFASRHDHDVVILTDIMTGNTITLWDADQVEKLHKVLEVYLREMDEERSYRENLQD